MNHFSRPMLITFVFVTCCVPLWADIINVPDDYEEVQDAVDASEDGDTVLVAPGRYEAEIDFAGKAITLLGNPDDPSEVLLDGFNSHAVVIFDDEEGENSILRGFTIQYGYQEYGGGIDIRDNSNPYIADCIISNNFATNWGGGIYVTGESAPIIENCLISENQAEMGGGISVANSATPVIINCTFDDNTAEEYGGAIHVTREATGTFESCDIIRNTAERGAVFGTNSGLVILKNSKVIDNYGRVYNAMWIAEANLIMEGCIVANNSSEYREGAIVIYDTDSTRLTNCTIYNNPESQNNGNAPSILIDNGFGDYLFENCIIWSDDAPEFRIDADSEEFSMTLSYSCIENDIGNHPNVETIGDIINDDPQFVDADEGDFNLTAESPCIDAGNPDSPRDPDGTIADIGAIYFSHSGILSGYVRDLASRELLEGVRVASYYPYETLTDTAGYWELTHAPDDSILLTFSKEGYNDTTLAAFELEMDETIGFTTFMRHPTFRTDLDELSASVDSGGSAEVTLQLYNEGNGHLAWHADVDWDLDEEIVEWQLQDSQELSDRLENSRLSGIAYADSTFIVSAGRPNDGDTNLIYFLNYNLEPIHAVPQPFADERAQISDLTIQGDTLWGAIDDYLCAMSLDGDSIYSVELDVTGLINPKRGLTYDPVNGLLWICSATSSLFGVNLDGEEMAEIVSELDRNYSLAYRADDPDGYPLYSFGLFREALSIMKYNPETGDSRFVTEIELEDGVDPAGIFISDQYSIYYSAFMGIGEDGGSDKLNIWSLHKDLEWIAIESKMGELAAEDSLSFRLTMSDIYPELDEYSGSLSFTHNALGGYLEIPLSMTVRANSISNSHKTTPDKFSIDAVYPNPFNAQLKIEYALPSRSDVSIELYDLSGRVVSMQSIASQPAGRHTAIIDGAELASGVYWVKVESKNKYATRKVVLLK
ncbi:right-handed parallel beta-helix repeat-containing protein [Calditrichota bacterium]